MIKTTFKKIPVAASVLSYRTLAGLLSDPIHYLIKIRNIHGKIFQLRVLHRKFIVVEDPGYFKDILQEQHKLFHKYDLSGLLTKFLGDGLITNNGPAWLRRRRIIQPGFSKHQVAGMAGIIHDELDKLMSKLKREGIDQPINLCSMFMELNFGVMARMLFGETAVSEIQLLSETMNELTIEADKQASQIVKLPLFIPSPANLRLKRARKKFDTILYSLISKRKKEIADGSATDQDILYMLLRSASPLNDRQLRNELTTLLMAGYETTSHTLSWLFYRIAGDPEIAPRVRSEINNQLSGNPCPPCHPLASDYITNLIKETMRFYPAVWLIVRKNTGDVVLGKYLLRNKSVVLLNVYGLHHNEMYWEKPNEFRPERWFKMEGMHNSSPCVFLPFGMGPRLCIGEPVAMMLMVMVVSRLTSAFDFIPAGNFDIGMRPLVTLRPTPDIYLRFKSLSP